MPDSVDALEVRAAHPAQPTEPDLADVLFPNLPPELGELNDYAKGVTEKNAKARLKATALLILKQQGHTRREIGRMLGMTANAVRVALSRARAAGKINELRGILENDSLALAIDSLNHHLLKKDKDATFKTLEGLGHFRSYQHQKHEGPLAGMPALTINIVNAPNDGGQQQIIGSAPIGTPRADAV